VCGQIDRTDPDGLHYVQPPKAKISPLGWRLAAATIAFSTFIALLATAFQLYLDYRHDLGNIDSTFDQVGQSYLPTIANALWATNRKELQVVLDGLARLPDVQYVAVRENAVLWAEAGKLKSRNVLSREYPLIHIHRGEQLAMGNLRVVMDMGGVYQRLLDKFWVILITNGVKTFLVAGFMLWLFSWLVTRHVHRIAEFASRMGLDNLDQRLTLARPASPGAAPDELDSVLDGLNRMQFNLSSSMNALRESEARFRVLFEQAAVGVALIQSDSGKFMRINQKYCDIVGYSQDEMRQIDSQAITYPDDLQADLDHMAALKAGTIREYSMEKRYRRKDGSLVWVNLTVSPTWQPGEPPLHHIAVVQDVTARKQAEAEIQQLNMELEGRVADRTAQLEAVNRELEAFSYSVSHDLRTPLRSIDGFSQALAEDYGEKLDTVGHDYLSRVRRAAQRMGLLIDDLLRLARVTRADMRHARIDLSALADEVTDYLCKHKGYSAAALTVQAGLASHGDPALLRIVLENLLDNAWKYSSKIPQPKIVFGRLEQGDRVVYFVRDNGAGFDMAYVNKLFGAFQRLHRDDDFSGTGVGLATVKRIVHRHGGEVWAEGFPGEGAVFYFTLNEPLHQATA
jgi:PAS domain S-box-containing protein